MKVKRIRDYTEFKKIRDVWNQSLFSSDQNNPFLTHEWLSTWWECFSQGCHLEVLLCKDEAGNILGMAPFMVKEKIIRFMASQEVSDYCDVVAVKGREQGLYKCLGDYLGMVHPEVKKIDLINIGSTSATLDFLPSLALKHKYSSSCTELEVAPVLELQASYENYLESLSKKKRHELRRKLKRIESLEGIRVEKITEARALESCLDEFITLHKQGSPSKSKFWEEPHMVEFFHQIARRFSRQKWIELNVCSLKGRILAALISFDYSDRVYFFNVTFDRNFAWYSPGIYLFNHCIQEAILNGKKVADFLRGREEYKYYFGAEDSKIFRLVLTPEKSRK
ncbi:MAG: GNAT family N-acetyltransferase [Candidatus Aminicenantes bacterium]|jgi:CelD/BcsL family acetyltransferase involved in cellulose biosynthesis